MKHLKLSQIKTDCLYDFKNTFKNPLELYHFITQSCIYSFILKLKSRQFTFYYNRIHQFNYKTQFKFIDFYKNVWIIIHYRYILITQSRKRSKLLTPKPKNYDDIS